VTSLLGAAVIQIQPVVATVIARAEAMILRRAGRTLRRGDDSVVRISTSIRPPCE
jgi:hypothetical protein